MLRKRVWVCWCEVTVGEFEDVATLIKGEGINICGNCGELLIVARRVEVKDIIGREDAWVRIACGCCYCALRCSRAGHPARSSSLPVGRVLVRVFPSSYCTFIAVTGISNRLSFPCSGGRKTRRCARVLYLGVAVTCTRVLVQVRHVSRMLCKHTW